MKPTILKLSVMSLILSGIVYSCGNKDEPNEPSIVECLPCGEAGGEVPFMPCPCEGEPWLVPEDGFPKLINFTQGEAYLVGNGRWPNQILDDGALGRTICVIYYDKNAVRMHTNNKDIIVHRGYICNFPDFAREWDLPEGGCKVDIEGVMYNSPCNYGLADAVYFDSVLTSLKRK